MGIRNQGWPAGLFWRCDAAATEVYSHECMREKWKLNLEAICWLVGVSEPVQPVELTET